MQDAKTFNIPDEATIFFFNDPFDVLVMDIVIANIRESQKRSPRKIIAIYVNPSHPTVFKDRGFTEVKSTVNKHNKGFMIFEC